MSTYIDHNTQVLESTDHLCKKNPISSEEQKLQEKRAEKELEDWLNEVIAALANTTGN